jgi:hypothetical protein
MRTTTGARDEGIDNEVREFLGVRVDSTKAGFALSLRKPEWPEASAMWRDNDEWSVARYVFDPAIRFEDWSSADEWTGRRRRRQNGPAIAGDKNEGYQCA